MNRRRSPPFFTDPSLSFYRVQYKYPSSSCFYFQDYLKTESFVFLVLSTAGGKEGLKLKKIKSDHKLLLITSSTVDGVVCFTMLLGASPATSMSPSFASVEKFRFLWMKTEDFVYLGFITGGLLITAIIVLTNLSVHIFRRLIHTHRTPLDYDDNT